MTVVRRFLPTTGGEHVEEPGQREPPSQLWLGLAINSELAVLASIEARYAHELTRLESSGTPPSVKEHLRQQLDARRKMARKPHVLRLAELYAERFLCSDSVMISPRVRRLESATDPRTAAIPITSANALACTKEVTRGMVPSPDGAQSEC